MAKIWKNQTKAKAKIQSTNESNKQTKPFAGPGGIGLEFFSYYQGFGKRRLANSKAAQATELVRGPPEQLNET